MAKPCPDCGLDLDKFGTRHRCVGQLAGERKATKLEADKIARGEMSPTDLLPKEKPATTPPGRLAPLKPYDRTTPQARQPQPSLADVLAAIEDLRAQFMKLADVLTKQPPRLDA